MARTYGKLMLEIWDAQSDFRELTEAAQRLYFLLFSHPSLNAAGVLPLQPRQWSRLAKDTTERSITRAFLELVATHKVLVDRDTEEVLVRAFIRIDGGATNTNIRKAIDKAIASVESDTLRNVALRELARATGHPPEDPSQGSCQHPPEDPSEPIIDTLDQTLGDSSTSTSTSTLPPDPPPPTSNPLPQDRSLGALPSNGKTIEKIKEELAAKLRMPT